MTTAKPFAPVREQSGAWTLRFYEPDAESTAAHFRLVVDVEFAGLCKARFASMQMAKELPVLAVHLRRRVLDWIEDNGTHLQVGAWSLASM